MNSMSCAVKRKKRKTRKCLDEMRKRSRGNTHEYSSPMVSRINNKVVNISDMKPNVCITSKRLTLPMFPKVIRSETITRPVLPEVNKSSIEEFEKMSMKLKKNPEPDQYIIQIPNSDIDFVKNSEEDCNNSIHSAWERCSGAGQTSLHKESDSGNLTTQNNSPGSVLLFSPVDQTEDTDLFEVSPNESLSSTSSQTSPNSGGGGYGDHLYEEFMNEIPLYLKQNAPALLKDDVMKKTKSLLHNIYLDSCRQDCEDNILHCMRSGMLENKCSTPESSDQSPMEYLQPRYQTQNGTLLAHSPPSSQPRPSLYNTPDYTYYPHKLNQ